MSSRTGEAFLLFTRPLGEQGYLAVLFSREFGFVRGLVRKVEGLCAGDTVRFVHTRRLEGQLGRLTVEVAISRAALMLTDPTAALVAAHVGEVCHHALPEGHPYPELYGALQALWQGPEVWWRRVARWERALLAATGYGLSLDDDPVPCPVGERLAYVSPASGRAVSLHVGAPYAARLLPLPALWGGPEVADKADCAAALQLTGSFLAKLLQGKDLTARARLVEHLTMQHKEFANGTFDDIAGDAAGQRRYG